MEIKQFVWDIVDSNSWLILEGKHGLLIDAVKSAGLEAEIKELVSITIILTHAHFDHIVGLNSLRELKSNATVIATSMCSDHIGNKFKNMSSTAEAFMAFYHEGENRNYKIDPFTCKPVDKTFEDGYRFEWFGHRIELNEVHGHSNDGLIAVVDDRYMFSGDTLLPIPTITRFPGGSGKRFWSEDIPMLNAMEGIEKIYPGHGMPGRMQDMLDVNVMPSLIKRLSDNLTF